MPQLIDTESRTGTLVAAVNHLLAEGGPRALSLRAVARESRVSASSIIHHLGGLEHLMRVSAHWTGTARRAQLASRWYDEGLLAHLPDTADHVVEARVWLAWCEMWRSEPAVEPTMREARDHERALLARQLDYELARTELDGLVALLDGLMVAVCRPERPMPPVRARKVLRVTYPRIGTPGQAVSEHASGMLSKAPAE
jgi:AcrR family transcriptional regulator